MDRIPEADVPASTPIRAKGLRRSPLSRLSFGHVVMIAAGLLAFLLNVYLVRSKDETMEVVVAARPISAGSRLGLDDLSSELVEAGGPFVDRIISGDAVDQLIGYVVVRDIAAGAPMMSDDLRLPASSDGRRAMSIPILSDHAVGGALHVGDRVDVISAEKGQGRFVAVAIEVLDVSAGDSRSSGDRLGVVVAVSEAEALAIAGALDGSAVHLVRSTGAHEEVNVPEFSVPAVRTEESGP